MAAELKTKQNDGSVDKFLSGIQDEAKHDDCYAIMKLMQQVTKAEAKLWGSSIVGFGNYHYKYESGREGDWFLVGFSPRKQNIALYLMSGLGIQKKNLEKLGKFKTGKSCLYINKLDQVDEKVLKEMIKTSVADTKARSKGKNK